MGDDQQPYPGKEKKGRFSQMSAIHIVIIIGVIVVAAIFIAKFGFGTDLVSPSSGEMSIVQQRHPVVTVVPTLRPDLRPTTTLLPAPSVTTTTPGPDTRSDPKNCGTIGNVCPAVWAAYSTCLGGKCSFTCKPNYDNCNKDPSDGCEAYLGVSGNCGGCGISCDVLHGYGDCSSSKCFIQRCDDGWYDCNDNLADGCETNIWSNDNCGSCGHTCASGTYCAKWACIMDCQYPKIVTYEGTCTDPLTDPKNCGVRGHVCYERPNAEATCTNGNCGFTCRKNYADCDKNAANGCEASLLTDANCGACGNQCGWNKHCTLFTDTTIGECFGTIF
jgi:hypothetical protein